MGPIEQLHVFDTSYSLVLHQLTNNADEVVRYEEAQRAKAEHPLHQFVDPYRRLAPELSWVLVPGDPTREVVKMAERCGADLLVVGQHGYLNTAHSLLGSVSEAALRNARCDVLVAPVAPPAERR